MSKPDNPYAFPDDGAQSGMTLRDYFAGQALAGMVSHETYCSEPIHHTALAAYQYADAMLAEREKSA